MKCIDSLSRTELHGTRVLVRLGLDLPLSTTGETRELFRLTQSLPTLHYLSEQGARSIIISKIGRDPRETNAPVARALARFLKVTYIPDLLGANVRTAIEAMRPGEIVLLENLQSDPREITGDDSFVTELASLGQIYVNDAFPSAHRTSATMVGLPKVMPSYAGLLMRDEVNNLERARTPAHPSFAILGGSKFETKSHLIKQLLETYDHVLVAGALANDVLKAQGYPVGTSLLSKEAPGADVLQHPHFVAPLDVTVQRPDGQALVKKPHEVLKDERIVDIGPETFACIVPLISGARFILWNGPTGIYEEGFEHWTQAIIEHVSRSEARKVIGGGDTLALIEKAGIAVEKLQFLSTGGGAMLEYILKGTLPGVDALR